MFAVACLLALATPQDPAATAPNIVFVLADDVGYGDPAFSGGTGAPTPNLDRLAREGRRFTDAHSTSATCTPSRYSLLTGSYAFRRPGTGVLRGDAALVLDPSKPTLASLLRKGGYRTAVIGKWHLGLGSGDLDWNGAIAPGPLECGFDESFVLPATGDRVPCVFVDGQRVAGLDPEDPLHVSYRERIDPSPSGKERPDLLRMRWSHGHDQTIVDGISRIGWSRGGLAARWHDEDLADRLVERAVDFVRRQKERPFFLYFATHDVHVPRVPHARFTGKSTMGPRGDALVQLDWQVGVLLDTLDELGLAEKTIVVFTSDNGPVLDDGYVDDAVAKCGEHRPCGPLRGGKYSAFEGGTRVPFVVRWPGVVLPGTSAALVSQVDACATLAQLAGVEIGDGDCGDSTDQTAAWFGADDAGRDHAVLQAGVLALREGRLKFVSAGKGPAFAAEVGIELGNAKDDQLYDLAADPGEREDLAGARPEDLARLKARLAALAAASPRK